MSEVHHLSDGKSKPNARITLHIMYIYVYMCIYVITPNMQNYIKLPSIACGNVHLQDRKDLYISRSISALHVTHDHQIRLTRSEGCLGELQVDPVQDLGLHSRPQQVAESLRKAPTQHPYQYSDRRNGCSPRPRGEKRGEISQAASRSSKTS